MSLSKRTISLADYLQTPDARYFVVRGRLWRLSDPNLDEATRSALVSSLMEARRNVGSAKKLGNAALLVKARLAVNEAKIALGERGPVWWGDDAPDYNRRMVENTPYADWHENLPDE